MLTPEQFHHSNHTVGKNYPGPPPSFQECWRCGKARAVCKQKIRFDGWAEAEQWVTEHNEFHAYVKPLTRYHCRWCHGWHMTKADNPISKARAERARRKWLTRLEAERRATRGS